MKKSLAVVICLACIAVGLAVGFFIKPDMKVLQNVPSLPVVNSPYGTYKGVFKSTYDESEFNVVLKVDDDDTFRLTFGSDRIEGKVEIEGDVIDLYEWKDGEYDDFGTLTKVDGYKLSTWWATVDLEKE